MAGVPALGSRRDFDYYDDNGTKWGISLDESNTKLVNSSGDAGACTATNRLPKNIRPRKVKVVDITGTVSRECIVLKLAPFAALNGSSSFTLAAVDSNDSTTVNVGNKSPEKIKRIIKNFDTGLTDGTNP